MNLKEDTMKQQTRTRPNAMLALAAAATLAVLAVPAMGQFDGFGPYTVLDTDFNNSGGVLAVDLNHDGLEDVVTWGFGAIVHPARAFLTRINSGTNPVTFTETFYTANASNGLIAGDFNNDGWTDLVPFQGRNPFPRFQVYFGDGTGALSAGPEQDVIIAISDNAKSVFGSDIDLDGDTDILFVDGAFPTTIIALYNDGSGLFSNQEVLITGSWTPQSISVADVDNDGVNEIVLATGDNNQGQVRIYDRPDTASPYQPGSVRSIVNSPSNIASGDIDLDGDIDLAVGGRGSGFNVSVLTNDGTGIFTRTDYDARFITQVELLDFDGDGNLDIVNSNESDRRFRIRLNDGSGVFGDAIDVSTGGTSGISRYLSFPDLDGNSSPDVAFPNGNNNGGSDTSFRFALNLTPIFAPGPFALSVPADNATDLALPEHISGWQIDAPKFTWQTPTGFAVTYDLSISTTGGSPVEVYSAAGLADPRHPVPTGVLVAGTEYEWQVTANNPIGSSVAPPFLMTMAPGPRACPPDLNGDGLLDFFDILDFLEAFSAGCP
jgi:VCBS repeat protein